MSNTDIYDLFTGALEVTNQSLESNRDSGIFSGLIAAMDKFLDGHRAGVSVYDEDPDKPFDYFTVRYVKGQLQLQSRGKSEHDTEWNVSRRYLQSLVDDPQRYIDNPAKLDIDWLKTWLPDSAATLLKKTGS